MKKLILILTIALISCKKQNVNPAPANPVQNNPQAVTTRTVQLDLMASGTGSLYIDWNYDCTHNNPSNGNQAEVHFMDGMTSKWTYSKVVNLTSDSMRFYGNIYPEPSWTITVNGSQVKTGTSQYCYYKY